VAGRVSEYLRVRLQNYQPIIHQLAAHKRGMSGGLDNPDTLAPLLTTNMVYFGAGSPTYTVRQVTDSLAWDYIRTAHRHGAIISAASAATIALGKLALPVYEIYKVGEDPFWKPGLDLLGPFGLAVVFIPHWNNTDGGTELDTSHCFMGQKRFERLCAQLPSDVVVVGMDEHTGLVIDFDEGSGWVGGNESVHILHGCKEVTYHKGEKFPLSAIGPYQKVTNPAEGLPSPIWQLYHEKNSPDLRVDTDIPEKVINLVALREEARQKKDWKTSDTLRKELIDLGWMVRDAPAGPILEKVRG
jgi:hypothetical protein